LTGEYINKYYYKCLNIIKIMGSDFCAFGKNMLVRVSQSMGSCEAKAFAELVPQVKALEEAFILIKDLKAQLYIANED